MDKKNFAQVLKAALAGIEFDAVYVAEEIGSYKPDLKNFQYLISHVRDDLGVQMEQILMTAVGLKSDHVPAMKMGMTSAVSTLSTSISLVESSETWKSCSNDFKSLFVKQSTDSYAIQWISRGKGDDELNEVEGKVAFTWRFDTMGDMAAAAEEEFGK